ncbi:hypothetical protein MBLNU230_g5377t1 [Neophaeotheca triangularis]
MSNYRPDYGRDGRRNDDRYHAPPPPPRGYDNNNSTYPPPPPPPGYGRSQYDYPSRNDHYAPPPRNDYYSFNAPRDQGPPPPPPGLPRGLREPPRYPARSSYENNNSNNGYTFQGAAAAGGHGGFDFNFRSQGQPAPHFPPANADNPNSNSRNLQRRNDNRPHRGRGDRGGGFRGRGRGRGGFKPFKAANRNILHDTNRETTPEQLENMNGDNQPRFKDPAAIPSSDEDAEADDAPRKRAKTTQDDGNQVPKWSNPDPYTALPPPETLGAPKKDIVQVIRKAKMENAGQTSGDNAAKQNVDFISFNEDVMEDDGESEDEGADDPFGAPAPASNDYKAGGSTSGPMGMRNSMRPLQNEFRMKQDYDADDGHAHAGQKRKREKESRFAKDIIEEWQSDGENATPWCTSDQSQNNDSAQRLNGEIKEFFDYVQPFDFEDTIRRDLIMRIQSAIQNWGPAKGNNVEVHSFGSFAAGLYLPTADMDLVAVSHNFRKKGIPMFCQSANSKYSLAAHLENCGLVTDRTMAVVARAKVPLLKYVDRLTGIKVDISFENSSGLRTNETFAQWKQQYPEMPVIVVLIKQLLAMRGRDEVFTGGLGGFSVICLVVSMLQHQPEVQAKSMKLDEHYGELLIQFLDLYGNRIDIRECGIRMNPPEYFSKTRNPHPSQRLTGLTIIDPNRADNDISGGSREINAVLDIFKSAHSAILRRLDEIARGEDVGESVLACMWGGNYVRFDTQRSKLDRLSRGMAMSPPPVPARDAQSMQKGANQRKVPKGAPKKKKVNKQNGSNVPDSTEQEKPKKKKKTKKAKGKNAVARPYD